MDFCVNIKNWHNNKTLHKSLIWFTLQWLISFDQYDIMALGFFFLFSLFHPFFLHNNCVTNGFLSLLLISFLSDYSLLISYMEFYFLYRALFLCFIWQYIYIYNHSKRKKEKEEETTLRGIIQKEIKTTLKGGCGLHWQSKLI